LSTEIQMSYNIGLDSTHQTNVHLISIHPEMDPLIRTTPRFQPRF